MTTYLETGRKNLPVADVQCLRFDVNLMPSSDSFYNEVNYKKLVKTSLGNNEVENTDTENTIDRYKDYEEESYIDNSEVLIDSYPVGLEPVCTGFFINHGKLKLKPVLPRSHNREKVKKLVSVKDKENRKKTKKKKHADGASLSEGKRLRKNLNPQGKDAKYDPNSLLKLLMKHTKKAKEALKIPRSKKTTMTVESSINDEQSRVSKHEVTNPTAKVKGQSDVKRGSVSKVKEVAISNQLAASPSTFQNFKTSHSPSLVPGSLNPAQILNVERTFAVSKSSRPSVSIVSSGRGGKKLNPSSSKSRRNSPKKTLQALKLQKKIDSVSSTDYGGALQSSNYGSEHGSLKPLVISNTEKSSPIPYTIKPMKNVSSSNNSLLTPGVVSLPFKLITLPDTTGALKAYKPDKPSSSNSSKISETLYSSRHGSNVGKALDASKTTKNVEISSQSSVLRESFEQSLKPGVSLKIRKLGENTRDFDSCNSYQAALDKSKCNSDRRLPKRSSTSSIEGTSNRGLKSHKSKNLSTFCKTGLVPASFRYKPETPNEPKAGSASGTANSFESYKAVYTPKSGSMNTSFSHKPTLNTDDKFAMSKTTISVAKVNPSSHYSTKQKLSNVSSPQYVMSNTGKILNAHTSSRPVIAFDGSICPLVSPATRKDPPTSFRRPSIELISTIGPSSG